MMFPPFCRQSSAGKPPAGVVTLGLYVHTIIMPLFYFFYNKLNYNKKFCFPGSGARIRCL